MDRGEIRWYSFKSPDKRRPILILTRSSALGYLGEVTVAPITSTIRDVPTEVVLDEQDGMKNRCAINLDHVQTVAKGKVGAYVTKISDTKLADVKSALLFSLGFDE